MNGPTIESQLRSYGEDLAQRDSNGLLVPGDTTARSAYPDLVLADRGSDAPPAPGAPLRSRRTAEGGGRRMWWLAVAAVVVVLAGAALLVTDGKEPAPTVATPTGPVTPDSYPTRGQDCGGDRVERAVSLAGPASAHLCIGLVPGDTGTARVVYLTSPDGTRIYGGWALGDCAGFYGSSGGQLTPGDDASSAPMIGTVDPSVAAVQFQLEDGTTLTTETVRIEGIDDVGFYSIVVPADSVNRIVGQTELDVSGDPIRSANPSCTPAAVTLPDEAATPIAAALIEESSQILGYRVGDRFTCPGSGTGPTTTPPMSGLVSQIAPDGPCVVVGWMPYDTVPGLRHGYYRQDGTLLKRMDLPGGTIVNRTSDLIGTPAPEISGTTVRGDTFDLTAMRGRWVLIDAYAQWCEQCNAVTDALTSIASARPDVQIVTIAADDDLQNVTEALSQRGARWPVIPLSLTDSVRFDYRFDRLPTTVLINPDGIVAAVFTDDNPATPGSIAAAIG